MIAFSSFVMLVMVEPIALCILHILANIGGLLGILFTMHSIHTAYYKNSMIVCHSEPPRGFSFCTIFSTSPRMHYKLHY